MDHFKHYLLILTSLFIVSDMQAQWGIYPNSPSEDGPRMDNVHFRSRDHGVLVSGKGNIYTTFDGGQNWNTQSFGNVYFRSIDFMNDSVGFVGSLQGAFLKTTDGGSTWSNIKTNFPISNPKICGISCTEEKIFGVGIYAEPAHLYISEDQGDSWTLIELDSLLAGAVDVYFKNDMEGYIGGIGRIAPDDGKNAFATIIQTLDGGASWRIVGESDLPNSIAWKMVFLDNGKIFSSVQNFSNFTVSYLTADTPAGPYRTVSFVHGSFDLFDPQGMGFIDDQHGWITGYGEGMYETLDGGETWNYIFVTRGINRFFKIDEGMIVGSGRLLYVFDNGSVSANEWPTLPDTEEVHAITRLSPNPAVDRLLASYRLDRHTLATVDIFSIDGSSVKRVHQVTQPPGAYDLDLDISDLTPGVYLLTLRTHDRHISKRFVKQ